MNILIVEDDDRLAHDVGRALLFAGHRADFAADGAAALEEVAGGAYDVIVLDGFSICRELRQRHIQTPVLMLAARDAVDDRVRGLDAGADDYLTKPFATEELLARVDPARHEVHHNERPIKLTPREFELLEFLMRHPGQVINRNQIFQNVWHDEASAGSNAVDLYMHYLRTKIDRDTPRPLIRTVRGVGYMIDG